MKHMCLLAILLSGCGRIETDPFYRTDLWQPEGASTGNLAAMMVDPHDLIRGRGAVGGSVKQADAAVDRLWHGRSAPIQPYEVTSFKAPAAQSAGVEPVGGRQN